VKKTISLLIALVMLMGMMAFASTAFAEDTWYLGILVHSLDNEFWAQEANGGILFAKSKPNVEYQVLITDGDDNKEIQAIKDFIAQHGDHAFFVADPASKANTANVVEICQAAGVKVSILWHHADGLEPKDYSSFVVHMSPDDFVAGYNTAKTLFDLMGGKGKVCALYGKQGEDSAANRYKGFEAALKEYPNIQLLDMQVASWSQDQAMTFAQTWLATYPDVGAIWAANDTMGLGAIEALKLEGKNGKVLVNGVDGIAAAYEAIVAGDMACTIANNGYLLMGYGAAYAYEVATGALAKVEKPVIKTQAVLVTAENVAEYKAMFIDGMPTYDYTNLKFCVLSDYASFADLAAAQAK
jgi:ribose transport system substrate-binding protein